MKSMNTAAVAVLFFLSQAPVLVHADMDMKGDPQKWEEKREEHQKKMLDKMTTDLNLSSDQQASIKKIMEDRGKKMETLHKESMEKGKAIMESSDKQIESVLNADQKTKFEAMKKEMKNKWKERREEHNEHHEESSQSGGESTTH